MGQSDWSVLYTGPPPVPLLLGTPEGGRRSRKVASDGTVHTTQLYLVLSKVLQRQNEKRLEGCHILGKLSTDGYKHTHTHTT